MLYAAVYRTKTYILNNATTSSVGTKLSISGCIWRSMNRRRRGKMVMGPKYNGSIFTGSFIAESDLPGLKYVSLATPIACGGLAIDDVRSTDLLACDACALRFARLASANSPS